MLKNQPWVHYSLYPGDTKKCKFLIELSSLLNNIVQPYIMYRLTKINKTGDETKNGGGGAATLG